MGEPAERLNTAMRAFQTLRESLNTPFSTVVRDSCLLRFSYTYDCCWKLMKDILDKQFGLICNSPKTCIREAFKNNLIDESETEQWLAMVNDRNQISHSYVEAIAQSLYNNLPLYADILESFIGSARASLKRN